MFTDDLATRVADLRLDDVAPADVERARQCVIDWLGAAIAGSRSTPAQMARQVIGQIAGSDDAATVWGTDQRYSCLDAALVNGVASHSMELDDVARWMGGHPSVSVCSAALSVGELLDADGSELLLAIIAGYDVACRLGLALGASHREAGWHVTGTVGAFAAAAATGRLLGLSADEVAGAFGLAASQASGINAGIGTTAKPLHAGRAATNGVVAAFLASHGGHGPADAIERYAEVTSTTFDPRVVDTAMRDEPGVRSVTFKRHACCGILQAEVTALRRMQVERGFRPEDVEAIDIADSPVALSLCSYDDPQDDLQAKFSYHHAAAASLVMTHTGPESFDLEAIGDERIRGLRSRVHVRAHDHPWTTVRVQLRSGEVLIVDEPPDAPAADEDLDEQRQRLEAKFRSLSSWWLGDDGVTAALAALSTLGSGVSVRSLVAAVLPPGRGPDVS